MEVIEGFKEFDNKIPKEHRKNPLGFLLFIALERIKDLENL